jgi:hypothetical protein
MSNYYLDTVEEVKNRPDKTKLIIRTMLPEDLLDPEVSSPESVKYLELSLAFHCDYSEMYKYLYKKNCDCDSIENCDKCCWDFKASDKFLCKDIVHFCNLETFVAREVNLAPEIWLEFAKNAKCLRKISFSSDKNGGSYFDFEDETPEKERILDIVFKIPTLESVTFCYVNLFFCPKGPSNLKYIEIDRVGSDEDKEYKKLIAESFRENFCTHQNLETVKILQTELDVESLKLDQLPKLKYVEYLNDSFDDSKVAQVFLSLLRKPNFKHLKIDKNCHDRLTFTLTN